MRYLNTFRLKQGSLVIERKEAYDAAALLVRYYGNVSNNLKLYY